MDVRAVWQDDVWLRAMSMLIVLFISNGANGCAVTVSESLIDARRLPT